MIRFIYSVINIVVMAKYKNVKTAMKHFGTIMDHDSRPYGFIDKNGTYYFTGYGNHSAFASDVLRSLDINYHDPENQILRKFQIVRITFYIDAIMCEHFCDLTSSQKETIKDFSATIRPDQYLYIDGHGNSSGNALRIL